MRYLVLVVLSVALASASWAQAPPEGVIKGVAYLPAGRKETADLYLPPKRGKDVRSPAVVIIHGGGWTKNDKADPRELVAATTLTNKGYVCLSINYWMEKDSLWPQNVQDCKNAVRWLRKNADKYRVDPNRIGVLGGSAGGHLALMVAYTPGVKELEPPTPYPGISDRVQAVVDMYGPSDLLTRQHVGEMARGTAVWYASKLLPHNAGKKSSAKESMPVRAQAEARIGKALLPQWKLASPVNHVTKDSPPTLILHGTADTVMNIEQSIELAKKLHAHKVAHRYIAVPGAHHAFALDGSYNDSTPKTKDVRAEVVAFFDEHLKPSR